jgi:CheY-like chemotaxis protein
MRRFTEILVVGDHPGGARLLRECVRDLSPQTHLSIATTGREALDLLGHEGPGGTLRPEVLVLDMALPDGSGWDVLAVTQTGALGCDTPVIMLTANELPIPRPPDGLGPDGYLMKPILLAEYRALVRRILEL